ncbi:MAG: Crp/Fnr family transcriptional regulator [Bacteroidales bacterium]
MSAFENLSSDLSRVLSDGEAVFFEGDEGREMYIIQKGQIAISRSINGEEVLVALKGKGDFIGEMALLESMPRSATARAVGDTRLLVIHAGGFLQKIRRDPTFAFEMLQRMSARFRVLNDQVRTLLENMGVSDAKAMAEVFTQFGDAKAGDDKPDDAAKESAPAENAEAVS